MNVSSLGKIMKGNATCSDLIGCLYSLNSTECDIFFSLYRTEEITLESVSAAAGRDKSTIHRILEKLVMAGFCFKDTKTMERGGYRNVYYAIEPDKLVEKLEYDIWRISDDLNGALRKFPESFKLRAGREIRK